MSSAKPTVGIYILGASGYGAGELYRLAAVHPHLEIAGAVSSSGDGTALGELHPHLRQVAHGHTASALDFSAASRFDRTAVIASLPHGKSGIMLREMIERGIPDNCAVIDLSGDLRLRDEEQRQLHYPDGPPDSFVNRFTYGLPEISRESIRTSRFVSNPGCLATACILSTAPLLNAALTEGPIVFDAKAGTSGAGRTLQALFHHPQMNSNACAYRILEHRHEPEIAQALRGFTRQPLETVFVPHVIPASRGILSTAYLTLAEPIERAELLRVMREFYRDAFFVRILDSAPMLSAVAGSNFTDISVFVRGRTAVVSCALDNLVKGMVGQAIQNLNLMCGLAEQMGLSSPGLGIL